MSKKKLKWRNWSEERTKRLRALELRNALEEGLGKKFHPKNYLKDSFPRNSYIGIPKRIKLQINAWKKAFILAQKIREKDNAKRKANKIRGVRGIQRNS